MQLFAEGCCKLRRIWHYSCSQACSDHLHAAACVALSSSNRTAGDRNRLRSVNLSRAAPPPPSSAPLHVTNSSRDARSRAHDAAAWQSQGSKGVRAEAWWLDRRTAVSVAEGGSLCQQHGAA